MADDSEDDRLFMRLALRNHPRLCIADEVRDGVEVMAYLSGTSVYADRERYPFPDMLLLDLDMPRFNGYQVLEWLRQQRFPELKVVVISSSYLKTRVSQSLALGADAYHMKASTRTELKLIVEGLERLL
ncbi:MAG: response regulator receiver protein [Pedosphaera sp.]|nr:response regulator receiver protein [Pedosphaera sp.]